MKYCPVTQPDMYFCFFCSVVLPLYSYLFNGFQPQAVRSVASISVVQPDRVLLGCNSALRWYINLKGGRATCSYEDGGGADNGN